MAETEVEGGEKKEGEEEAKTDGTTINKNMSDLQWVSLKPNSFNENSFLKLVLTV